MNVSIGIVTNSLRDHAIRRTFTVTERDGPVTLLTSYYRVRGFIVANRFRSVSFMVPSGEKRGHSR